MPRSTRASVADKFDESEEFEYAPPRDVRLTVTLFGGPKTAEEHLFLVLFNGHIILDTKWIGGTVLELNALPVNLKDPVAQDIIADNPLVLLLRTVGGKGPKDSDPLTNSDNRAGATFDLLPLLIGQERQSNCIRLLDIWSGQPTRYEVEVTVECILPQEQPIGKVPLMITMVSAHCLPLARDGTVYVGAIALDELLEHKAVHFGMSLSTKGAQKLVWASASSGGYGANTEFNIPYEDKFIPEDLTLKDTAECRVFYWNAMKRVLVDPKLLTARLSTPFLVEIAGVPRSGKVDVRGRYMGFLDARPLLVPEQFGVTSCVKLKLFNEANMPKDVGPILEIPPSSGKTTLRDTDLITDEFGHSAYVIIRLDLIDVLVPKRKMVVLYKTIGFSPPEGRLYTVPELEIEPPPDDPFIDVRKIRKEGGALAVHKELSSLACRGSVAMNTGIKRTVANRLLIRIRAMLKQFSPGECSYIEWQDTVTGQHAASRRAITASFAPQPPPLRLPPKIAAARCRMAGDTRIASMLLDTQLKIDNKHPRALLSKALQCLEANNNIAAKKFITEGLSSQPRNRFLLWMFGGQEFDKGHEAAEMAAAAFRMAAKGDYSDGFSLTISWGAVHVVRHFVNNAPYAFVAAKRMRKSFDLPGEWKQFLKRWIETSGEEEIYWVPAVVSQDDPLILTAAFFLCLRCYKFCEMTLRCVENGCGYSGNRHNLKSKPNVDIYYLRASSLILRRQYGNAFEMTMLGIQKFRPSPKMTQLWLMSLACMRDWDDDCEHALGEAEKAGATLCPTLLLKGAEGSMKYDYEMALQRAARAHKYSPSAHTALTIARIYSAMEESVTAEKWAAAAVKVEPLLSDGWALLAILAMAERKVDKARTLLRTAYQVGPISSDIEEHIIELMDNLQIHPLPESLVKNLCFCEYY